MKTVLITGGSSGIGFEMSRIWANHGYRLLWVSHDKSELDKATKQLSKEIPEILIHTFLKDLTLEEAPSEVYSWAKNLGSVDILINNAGKGTYGFVQQIELEKEISMIKLNAISLYRMTRLFLDDMITRKEGTIINICSNSSFQPVPRMTTYAATKGFVYQFSRGLQDELEIQKSNVRVITVCPAAIKDTPFKDHLSQKVKTFDGLATTTAKEVAYDTWNGFKNGKSFIVTGRKMRWLYAIRGLIPVGLQKILVRKETEQL